MEVEMAELEKNTGVIDIEEVRRQTLRFASSMKKMFVILEKMDFYSFFYYTCAEDFDPKVPIMAMSYRDMVSFALPTIVYGAGLIPFIEMALERDPHVADGFIREIKRARTVSKESEELLKRFFIFRELVKHEIIHYINLHLPRTIEFFKKKGIQQIPESLFMLSNIVADSICNIYLDKEVIKSAGLVPPLEKEIPLEVLLEELLKNSKFKTALMMGSGSGNDKNNNNNGGKGNGNNTDNNNNGGGGNMVEDFKNGKNGFPDFSYDDLKDLSKHDFERLKEVMGQVVEKITEEYKRSSKTIGNIPNEVEETIKWLKKRKVKFRLTGRDNLFGLFREVERTYIAYNPLNRNKDGLVFPSYRPLGGFVVAVVVDTSGSMKPEELSYSFDLINGLVKQAEIYLVEIDAKIQWVKKVGQIREEFTFKGRGGTSFTDLERLSKLLPASEVRVCILLTDGYVDEFPKQNPLPKAKWVGITTSQIPKNSPDWINWFKVEQVLEE
jgi:predicted metal-dependent peptidase